MPREQQDQRLMVTPMGEGGLILAESQCAALLQGVNVDPPPQETRVIPMTITTRARQPRPPGPSLRQPIS